MKITLTKLSTEELAALADRVIHSSKNGNYTVVENHPLLLEIEKEYEEYRKVYEKVTYSGKGTQIAEYDHERDEIYKGLKNFLKGYSNLPSAINNGDAVALYKILQKYGLDLSQVNYAEETARIDLLLEELRKTENWERVTRLGLVVAINDFSTANSNFKTLYEEQAEANAYLRSLPTATELRKGLEDALRSYFFLLEAMKKQEDWQGIYYDINELVKGVQ